MLSLGSNNTAELTALGETMRCLLFGTNYKGRVIHYDSVYVRKMATGQRRPRSNIELSNLTSSPKWPVFGPFTGDTSMGILASRATSRQIATPTEVLEVNYACGLKTTDLRNLKGRREPA